MKVFISESISIKSLDDRVVEKLDSIISKGYTILIGEAYGVDLLVQRYLNKCKYSNVKIYASNGKVRNNVGNWEVIPIIVNNVSTGREFYTAKDIAMSRGEDIGFAIYDGASKGTRANINRLKEMRKNVIVYNNNLKSFYLL